MGHAWLITDLAGTCIGYVIASQTSQRYVITNPASPPQTTQTTTTTSAPKPRPQPKPAPKPAAPAMSSVHVTSHPAAPRSGSSFTVTAQIVLTNGTRIGAASATCRATVAGVPLRGTGKGGCTFRLAKTAGGKRLAITVVATYRGKTKGRSVAYTIRRAPPKPKPKPAAPSPAAGSGVISTPVGRLALDGVQLTDRFPPGCVQASFGCDVAEPGYRILVVWLKIVSGNPAAVVKELTDAKVVVVASDGSRTTPYSGGLLNGRLFLAFTPRSSSHGFKLLWPGNPPIALGK